MDQELKYTNYHDLLYDIHSYFYAFFDCFRKCMPVNINSDTCNMS